MAELGRIDMRVDTANKLKRLAADLREAGRKDMRKALLKEIRAAGKPAVADVRRAVLATPSKGARGGKTAHQGGRGLRATIAKATGLSISTSGNASIRVRVNNKRVEPATLAKYLDGELGSFARWRHPVFGDTDRWVQQDSHPFFFSTMRTHRDDFRRAVQTAIDDVIDDLGG